MGRVSLSSTQRCAPPLHTGCLIWQAVRILSEEGFSPPRGREAEARNLQLACISNETLCHLRLKQWTLAETCATTVLRRDPRNAKAFYRRGVARLELEDPHAALRDLKEAVCCEAISPRSPIPRTHELFSG